MAAKAIVKVWHGGVVVSWGVFTEAFSLARG